MNQVAEPGARYGGSWTVKKLKILEKYLDAYTTALKNKPFKLMYIDAFAGTGQVPLSAGGVNRFALWDSGDDDLRGFVSGSAERAIKIDNKPFDKLIFVEKEVDRCADLEKLRSTHSGRNIKIENSEANEFLSDLREDWYSWRGVLFLDPFATEVEWSTIQSIAGFEALDTWILFPVSAIARMLPTSCRPDDISPEWAKRLTRIFGDESWRDLYWSWTNLFGGNVFERQPGVGGLITIYKNNLERLFGNRFLKQSRTLKNSKDSPLFEFMFCVGSPNPKAIAAAKGIAKHILDKL